MSESEELSLSGDFQSIAKLIRARRNRALQAVNNELVSLYWEIGKTLHIKTEAENWGQKTIDGLAAYLKSEHPDLRGFSRRGLYRMKQFYETYPGEIVPTLLTQLSWSHNLLIFSQCKTAEERGFYLQATLPILIQHARSQTRPIHLRQLRAERQVRSRQRAWYAPDGGARLPKARRAMRAASGDRRSDGGVRLPKARRAMLAHQIASGFREEPRLDVHRAREAHFPATIAELYDPKSMPDNLRAAHERNDEVLERIYIGRRFKNDTERLEKLFNLYTKMTTNQGAKTS